MRKLLTGVLMCGMFALASMNVGAVNQPYMDNVASQDDIESLYAFTLEGAEYTLPIALEDLKANGWDFYQTQDATNKIPGMTISGYWLVKDGDAEKAVCFYFLNATGNAVEAQNARIAGIDVDSEANVDFALESGLKIGSTAAEVEAVYGASEEYQYEFSEILREKGSDLEESMRNLSLVFNEAADSDSTVFRMDDAQTVSEIELDYYKTFPEDATEASGRPEYLDAYTAPAAVNDGFTPMTFELDGVLYQMPTPLSVFLENGWTMEKEDETVYGLGHGSMRIRKGDMLISADLENLDDLMVNAEDTIVTSLQFSLDEDWAPDALKVPYGIDGTITDEELRTLFPAINEVQLDGSSGSLEKDGIRYNISDYQSDDSDYHSYSVQISDMENRDNRISVNYSLDEANTPDFIVLYSTEEWNY